MIQIIPISKEYLKDNLNSFISILKDIPNEYWNKDNFLLDLPCKWEYSFVALDNNKILGFLIASCKVNNIHIHKLMIDSKCRGNGIGSFLINHLEEKAKNQFDMMTLKVYKDNVNAIKFYYNHNYKKIDDSNDLITMGKKI